MGVTRGSSCLVAITKQAGAPEVGIGQVQRRRADLLALSKNQDRAAMVTWESDEKLAFGILGWHYDIQSSLPRLGLVLFTLE